MYCCAPGADLCVCSGSALVLGSVEMYDPITGEWSAAASLATARRNHSCVTLESKLWVAGGLDADNR